MRHALKSHDARGYTLVQLLLTAMALSVLTALLFSWVSYARPRARMAACTSQLRQIGQAINLYRSDFSDHLPPWLSNLYPKYVKQQHIFICPSDDHRGTEGAIPSWCSGYQFAETDDTSSRTSAGGSDAMVEYGEALVDPRSVRNADVRGVGYFYQFGILRCSWWMDFDLPMLPDVLCGNSDGVVSWREAMMARASELDADFRASDTRAMPDPESASADETHMVYCLWHASRDSGRADVNKLLTLVLDGEHVYALDDHLVSGHGQVIPRSVSLNCGPQSGTYR